MTTSIDMNDAEISALLAELEAEQNAGAAPAPAKAEVKPEPNATTVAAMTEAREIAASKEPKAAPVEDRVIDPIEARNSFSESVKEEAPIKATRLPQELYKPDPEEEKIIATAEPELVPSEDVPQTARAKTHNGLQYFVDIKQFNAETKLTEATLDDAMMQQAGLRAFYGSQAAQAEAQHARLKVRFEVLEAKLYDEHRKTLAAAGEKVTEKMVENAVKLDPRWLKGKNTVIEAETIASINKSLVISLADRRDMMIQLGADRREEFKGGVRIMAEQNERDALASRARLAFKNGAGGVQ